MEAVYFLVLGQVSFALTPGQRLTTVRPTRLGLSGLFRLLLGTTIPSYRIRSSGLTGARTQSPR